MLKRHLLKTIALLIIGTALSGCGNEQVWVQTSDGFVKSQIHWCTDNGEGRNAELYRQCLLNNFEILTYDKQYLESLGFRCGYAEQYCLLNHSERQYLTNWLGQKRDQFSEYRINIYLKYIDKNLSVFKVRFESVDAQGNIRFRSETPDALP